MGRCSEMGVFGNSRKSYGGNGLSISSSSIALLDLVIIDIWRVLRIRASLRRRPWVTSALGLKHRLVSGDFRSGPQTSYQS